MKRKIILHVGLHKTGSTSIQASCKKYSEQLFKAGISYAKFDDSRWENHSVPLSLIFQDLPRDRNHTVHNVYKCDEDAAAAALSMRKYFSQELISENTETLLLSGEDFSDFSLDELEKFKTFVLQLRDFEISVIIYVRHPVSFALSGAQELVRAGVMSLSSVFELGNTQNAERKINDVTKVFGIERTHVFSFDDAIAQYGDVTKHFFNFLNCPHIQLEKLQSNSASSIEKVLVLSGCHDYGFEVTSLLRTHLPDKGTKFAIDFKLQRYFWLSSERDRLYLKTEFGIDFPENFHQEKSVINFDLLYLLIRDTYALLRENGLNVTLKDIYFKIIKDTMIFFPSLSSLICVMAYNFFNSKIFQDYIYYFMASGILEGEFVNEIFVMSGDKLNASRFDGKAYLLKNKDVALAGIDPFHHYYVFGKFEGRTGFPFPLK